MEFDKMEFDLRSTLTAPELERRARESALRVASFVSGLNQYENIDFDPAHDDENSLIPLIDDAGEPADPELVERLTTRFVSLLMSHYDVVPDPVQVPVLSE